MFARTLSVGPQATTDVQTVNSLYFAVLDQLVVWMIHLRLNFLLYYLPIVYFPLVWIIHIVAPSQCRS